MRCDISFLSNPYVKRFSLRLDFRYGFFHILSLSFSFVGILDFDWAAKSLRVYCKIHRLLTLTSQMFIASLMSYSLNVIPMDLFCLSGISCRVIDYGQFSKHPTANTWSISSKMCFVWCFFSLALSPSNSLDVMRFGFSSTFIFPHSIKQSIAWFLPIVFFSTKIALKIQFNWFCWLCLEIFQRVYRTFDYPFSCWKFFSLAHSVGRSVFASCFARVHFAHRLKQWNTHTQRFVSDWFSECFQ